MISNVTINPNRLNAEQLARLYVVMIDTGQNFLDTQTVFDAGIANAGEAEFLAEVARIVSGDTAPSQPERAPRAIRPNAV